MNHPPLPGLEEDWSDVRPEPRTTEGYAEAFQKGMDAAAEQDSRRPFLDPPRGVEALANRLGVDVEVLTRPGQERTGDISLSLWFRAGEGPASLIDHPGYYHLRLDDAGTVSFLADNIHFRSTSTFDDGVWHHLVITASTVTYDVQFFVDGRLEPLTFLGNVALPTSRDEEGHPYRQQPGEMFSGQIASLAVWDAELDAEQIRELYSTPGQTPVHCLPASDHLVGYWNLDVDGTPPTRAEAVASALSGPATEGQDMPTRAQEWVANYCLDHNLDWDKLSKGERFRIQMTIPCSIRCFRVGGPVDVEDGERCPECGQIYHAPPTAWERLAEGR